MKLSVITACLPSKAEFLAETAASIPHRLNMDSKTWDVEWILVLDGKGNMPPFVNKTPTIIMQTGHREGVSAARNRALLASTGEWIVNLDGDDKLIPDGLNMVAETIEDNNNVGWAAGVLLNNGVKPYPELTESSNKVWNPGQLVDEWTVPMAFHPGVTWMRRDLLLATGGWPALTAVEDKLPVFAVSELSAGVTVPHATHFYRRHPEQSTITESHAEGREHALKFTASVLTERRRLNDKNSSKVEPKQPH